MHGISMPRKKRRSIYLWLVRDMLSVTYHEIMCLSISSLPDFDHGRRARPRRRPSCSSQASARRGSPGARSAPGGTAAKPISAGRTPRWHDPKGCGILRRQPRSQLYSASKESYDAQSSLGGSKHGQDWHYRRCCRRCSARAILRDRRNRLARSCQGAGGCRPPGHPQGLRLIRGAAGRPGDRGGL